MQNLLWAVVFWAVGVCAIALGGYEIRLVMAP